MQQLPHMHPCLRCYGLRGQQGGRSHCVAIKWFRTTRAGGRTHLLEWKNARTAAATSECGGSGGLCGGTK